MSLLISPMLHEVSRINRERAHEWHRGATPWLGSDWSNAMCGEAGEAANFVKKLRRLETGILSDTMNPHVLREQLIQGLTKEIADVILYADLLAWYYNISTASALVEKFNDVSRKKGFDQLLPEVRLKGYDE